MKHVLFLIIVLSCNCILLSGQNNVPKNPFVPRTQPAQIIANKKDTAQNILCGKSGSLRKTDFAHAIDMLGFEKRLNDRTETFMLQNNTENLVTRVKLKITYRAPNGKMIDYREVMVDGELLPHNNPTIRNRKFRQGQTILFSQKYRRKQKIRGLPFPYTILATAIRYCHYPIKFELISFFLTANTAANSFCGMFFALVLIVF